MDKDRKIARIPLDRAMQIVAERGLPKWPAVSVEAASAGTADHSPVQPAASAPQGSGKTTPIQEGAKQ